MPDRSRLARARAGTTATFGLAGAVGAVWTVRLPALTDKLHLDAGRLGVVVLAFGVGSTLAMQAARPLIERVGSRRTLLAAAPATPALSAAVGLAPSYGWLLAGCAAFGAAFGVLDLGMNAQAAVLERVTGRHLMNGAHAGWSVGAVTGGALGALSAYARLSFTAAVVTGALVALPVAAALSTTYLPDPRPAGVGRGRPGRVPRVVYLVGLVTVSSFLIEGAAANWGGLYVRNTLRGSDAVAALAYPALEAAMIIGRSLGDRVRRAVGSRAMLVAGGAGVVAGYLTAVAARHWSVALLGFFLVGLATSTVVPLTFSIAGRLAPGGAGIAQAGAMGYAGMLLGPVGIGYLANATSLRSALAVGVGLGAVISVLGRLLPADEAPGRRAPAAPTPPARPADPPPPAG